MEEDYIKQHLHFQLHHQLLKNMALLLHKFKNLPMVLVVTMSIKKYREETYL